MKQPKPSGASFEVAARLYGGGNKDQAREVCLRLVKQSPRDPRASYLLGIMALEEGRAHEAVEQLERAVALAPASAPYLANLGLAYSRIPNLEKAHEALARAQAADPMLVEAAYNLGLVELERGELEAALRHLQRAVELRPNAFPMQRAFARALARAERIDDAVERYKTAASLVRNTRELELELFSMLQKHGRLSEAEGVARGLVQKHPELAEAHFRLGQVLSKQGQLEAAMVCFERAAELDPKHVASRRELGLTFLRLGCLDDGLPFLEQAVELDPMAMAAHSRLVFHASFSSRYDAERILAAARHFAACHAEPLAARRQPHTNDRSVGRRLRIGYVSPEFRDHAQRLFTLPVFREHDHEGFEIVCYSSTSPADEWTARIRGYADAWHDVGALNDAELAERVRNDGIDVLVDLNMHMAGQRLRVFAEKPAPVSITWLAYPGTTGIGAIDFRITDPHLDPPGQSLPYSEQSLWLPQSFWCYDPGSDEPKLNELPAQSAGHVTFGCLNNFLKVNAAVLELWARVLESVPNSRFLLLAPSARARDFASRQLESRGVSLSRVDFVELMWRKDYLATYHRIDVALDCFPYNGHTTSLDAFWMGVPVVSLVGTTIVGRAGLCQAVNLGLPELAADSPDEFVETASRLASDLPRLAALRSELRARLTGSPLMDAPKFTRALEAAYREAWRRWCQP